MKSPKPKHSKGKDRRMHGGGDPDLDSLNRDLAEAVQKVRETAPQVRSSRVYKEKGQLRLKVHLSERKEFSRYFKVCEFDKVPDFCKYDFLNWVCGKLNVPVNKEPVSQAVQPIMEVSNIEDINPLHNECLSLNKEQIKNKIADNDTENGETAANESKNKIIVMGTVNESVNDACVKFEAKELKSSPFDTKHEHNATFYYATIAYHVGLNAVLGLPHPGPTS